MSSRIRGNWDFRWATWPPHGGTTVSFFDFGKRFTDVSDGGRLRWGSSKRCFFDFGGLFIIKIDKRYFCDFRCASAVSQRPVRRKYGPGCSHSHFCRPCRSKGGLPGFFSLRHWRVQPGVGFLKICFWLQPEHYFRDWPYLRLL